MHLSPQPGSVQHSNRDRWPTALIELSCFAGTCACCGGTAIEEGSGNAGMHVHRLIQAAGEGDSAIEIQRRPVGTPHHFALKAWARLHPPPQLLPPYWACSATPADARAIAAGMKSLREQGALTFTLLLQQAANPTHLHGILP